MHIFVNATMASAASLHRGAALIFSELIPCALSVANDSARHLVPGKREGIGSPCHVRALSPKPETAGQLTGRTRRGWKIKNLPDP